MREIIQTNDIIVYQLRLEYFEYDEKVRNILLKYIWCSIEIKECFFCTIISHFIKLVET